jgi:hypothetical protein
MGGEFAGSAGIEAYGPGWRAGDDTIKELALAAVKANEAFEEAKQSRLPSSTTLVRSGPRSHMQDVLDDMVELHRVGTLPKRFAPTCRLLHEQDVVKHGPNNAEAIGTIRNNLREAFNDLQAGRPIKPIKQYRPN